MNTYRMEIVTQYIHIKAETEEQAELQYANFWSGLNCYYHENVRLDQEECECAILHEGDIYHNTELIGKD